MPFGADGATPPGGSGPQRVMRESSSLPPNRSLPPLEPLDSANRDLLACVHPPDWRNPTPISRYDLVVIGGGTAGLVTAAGAAGLGARVALVERHLLGGDCLNTGCVPSKSILRCARAAAAARRAAEFGLRGADAPEVDFGAVMERMRRQRAKLAPHDSARRFAELGVDVFLGHARFVDPATVEVEGARLRFGRAAIATGARATVPEVPGLGDAAPRTHETVFNLTERPRRLAVLGGGPVGCELAQAFRRLGSEVLLLHRHDHLLDREDAEAADVLQETLRREGLELALDAELLRVETNPAARVLHYRTPAGLRRTEVDAILVATGRTPNIEHLDLAAAGVTADPRRGVHVDPYLRTANPRIFACGDVCLPWKFTHAADASARVLVQNALFSLGPLGRRRWTDLVVPWCTYTDPEIARLGLSASEARDRGLAIDSFTLPFDRVDRAITDGDTAGFVRIHTRRGTGTIVGAVIVGAGAGDLIGEVAVAMAGRIGLGRLAGVIHPYPTRAEALRKVGDLYNRTRLTEGRRRLLRGWLRWRTA
jgi:pyruvate/2-oxoglutarate dehydrogenase complex dihydrolipoamide dehydrogenase (E3) component